jgi:hypothetical protein
VRWWGQGPAKKLRKEWESHKKNHERYLAKAAAQNGAEGAEAGGGDGAEHVNGEGEN